MLAHIGHLLCDLRVVLSLGPSRVLCARERLAVEAEELQVLRNPALALGNLVCVGVCVCVCMSECGEAW